MFTAETIDKTNKKIDKKMRELILSGENIPKCCEQCNQQICDENGMIVNQYRHGNEMVESVDKCYKLIEEENE